jgi:hypothetical protein
MNISQQPLAGGVPLPVAPIAEQMDLGRQIVSN